MMRLTVKGVGSAVWVRIPVRHIVSGFDPWGKYNVEVVLGMRCGVGQDVGV